MRIHHISQESLFTVSRFLSLSLLSSLCVYVQMLEFRLTKIKFRIKFIWRHFLVVRPQFVSDNIHDHRKCLCYMVENFMQNNNHRIVCAAIAIGSVCESYSHQCTHIFANDEVVMESDFGIYWTLFSFSFFYWYLCAVYSDINVQTNVFPVMCITIPIDDNA